MTAGTRVAKEERTLRVLGRALKEAPVLRRGLGLTVAMAAAGTAIQIIVPIAMQQIIDEELLTPEQIDLGRVGNKLLLAALGLVLGTVIGRAALLRLADSYYEEGSLDALTEALFRYRDYQSRFPGRPVFNMQKPEKLSI